ncbi:hypothetical protein RM533_02775 [Croceicoccus sp. F390]|uniref:Uncharacterized protein n=1 Tax=Croceicoccus esteveae TaxID=3075597 RepID=A0ABU2ZES8_9SPHN|nr:hypothetical protein [Croceicoccus sp. F390]MDT0575107.1 hypothetical protein [Croceicoccus sp. F390]
MSMPQLELERAVLFALYNFAQKQGGRVNAVGIQQILPEQITETRISLALGQLERSGFVFSFHARFSKSPTDYEITDQGYKEAEKIVGEAERLEADPIASLEMQLAPAAGRMVSFGDNQDNREQMIALVEQAKETIRSSNSINEAVRDDAVAHLSAWKGLIENSKTFAVGAFRFMVWDRIKKVIEGEIEDVYLITLTCTLITLGTIMVGLL